MYSFLEVISSISNKGLVQTMLWFAAMLLSATLWNRGMKTTRTENLVNKFPGLKKFGILGSIPQMYHLAFNPARDVLDWVQRLAEIHGPIYRYWILNRPVFVLCHTELAIKLYQNDYLMDKASDVVKAANAVGGAGLLALPQNIHSRRKKQWMPSFTRKQVEKSIKFFSQEAVRLCKELSENERNGTVFDLVGPSVECTFRAICYSTFGKDYMDKLPESVGRDHMHDLHIVSLNMTSRTFRPWLFNDFLYFHGTQEGRETMRSVKRGNRLTKEAINDRQKYRIDLDKQRSSSKNKKGMVATDDVGTTSGSDEDFECFLDSMLVLMNNGQLTEKEVVQELNVFIAAGYDTSGITICYVLYFLSLYPEHQEKIIEELCHVFPKESWNDITNYSITPLEIKQMKYLELCIKETLRLYPTLPLSPRCTTSDVELPDGRTIPKGVDIFIALNLIQRDPRYFPEPNKFLPLRHLEPSPAYMPFTLGSRNCIGQVYAMYEMKVIVAYLLMSYKFETTEKEGFKPIFQTLQVPENGMHFKITKRTF